MESAGVTGAHSQLVGEKELARGVSPALVLLSSFLRDEWGGLQDRKHCWGSCIMKRTPVRTVEGSFGESP